MDDAPSSTLTVKVGEETREIFMSFGLLNELVKPVGSIERVPQIDLDPDMAAYVVRTCLIPRDARGKPTDPEWEPPFDLTAKDAEDILDWVKGHVLHFFMRRLRKNVEVLSSRKEELKDIGSSLLGLGNSPSPIPSSSVSASAPAP